MSIARLTGTPEVEGRVCTSAFPVHGSFLLKIPGNDCTHFPRLSIYIKFPFRITWRLDHACKYPSGKVVAPPPRRTPSGTAPCPAQLDAFTPFHSLRACAGRTCGCRRKWLRVRWKRKLFLPSLLFSSRAAFLGHASGLKGLLPESGKAEAG